MKYLYFLDSSYCPTAASTNRLFAFAHSLSERGCKCRFYYLFPDKKLSKSERYTDEFEFVYLWEDWTIRNKYLNTIRSMWKFYKLMKPEIPIYAYSLLNCIYFLRKKKGIRLYHEYTENPEVIGRIGGFVGEYLYRLYKKTIPKLDGLFLITPALCDKYINEFGADPDKTVLLNMVVDKSRFERITEIESEKVISYCGIISEFKDGVSILIKAFAQVASTHPDYKLRLIGPFIDEQTEKNLKELVNHLRIAEKVQFAGVVPAEDMPRLLMQSSILALARPDNIQAKYGFATKIGEYLMTERPVVLTRVGAVENYLTDKVDCILAKPDDVDDFAGKLIWLIDNFEQAKEIGKRGKAVVSKYFDSEKETEKIYNVIFG